MLKDLIIKSRSYRRFKPTEPIPTKTLKELINLARLSPSARNDQPLKYMIVNDTETNAKVFATLSLAKSLKWEGPAAKEKPAAYIILLSETSNPFVHIDSGIAARSIMLGATEKGLGGCILGAIDRPKLQKTLNIPKQYEILLVLALGTPGEKVILEDLKEEGTKYWRDENDVHHVAKRKLEDIII